MCDTQDSATVSSQGQNAQYQQPKDREAYFDPVSVCGQLAPLQEQEGRGVWQKEKSSTQGSQEVGRRKETGRKGEKPFWVTLTVTPKPRP